MEPTDITIEILKSIRDEVKAVGVRVDAVRTELKGEISSLRTELRGEISALRDQQVRAEIHLATELVASTAEFRALREDLKTMGVHTRLDDHERRIEALEGRAE